MFFRSRHAWILEVVSRTFGRQGRRPFRVIREAVDWGSTDLEGRHAGCLKLLLVLLLMVVGCHRNQVDVTVNIDGEAGDTEVVSESHSATAANGTSSNAASSTVSDDGNQALVGVIGFSALTLSNPFFTVIADNMIAEAESHGYEVVVDDANRDVKAQSEQIDTYITRGVSAIVVNPCDRLSLGPAIRRANEAGIPVFTCDLQCVAENVEIAGHVGTDNFQGGRLAGQAMIEALGEAGGKVLILSFHQANSCVLRVEGFLEVIEQHNASSEEGQIEIVADLDGGGLRPPGREATAAALQTNPDLDGIFAINDPSGLGAYAALEQAGKTDQVTIVAFDGQLDGKRAILEGKIYADPIQFPDQMGRLTVRNIMKYLNGEEYEKVTLIPTELYLKEDADRDPELAVE